MQRKGLCISFRSWLLGLAHPLSWLFTSTFLLPCVSGWALSGVEGTRAATKACRKYTPVCLQLMQPAGTTWAGRAGSKELNLLLLGLAPFSLTEAGRPSNSKP